MAAYYDACVIVAGDAGMGGTRKAAVSVDNVTGADAGGSDSDKDAVRTKNRGG